jgi:CHAD domain-containing protein
MRNELRWAGSLLAETRDLDILLRRLEKWSTKRKATHPPASGVDQAFDRVRAERLEAHGRLTAALASERYEALIEELVRLAAKLESAAASIPADEFGLQWVRKAAKPMRPWLRRDISDLKESELHRARRLLRRLRYVVEFFADCLGVEVQRVLKHLILTQNTLGALQDASVAGALLKTVNQNAVGTEPLDPALSLVAEAFAKGQSKRAKKTRKRLEKRWKRLRKALRKTKLLAK